MIRYHCRVKYLSKRYFFGFALDIELKHFACHSNYYRQLESLERLYPLRCQHLRRRTPRNLSGLAPRQEPLKLAGCSQLLSPAFRESWR